MTTTEDTKIAPETEAKTTAETPVADEHEIAENAPIDDEALADVSGGMRRVGAQ